MRASLCLLLAALLVGCGTGYTKRDDERRPEIITGTGATILYPGQGPPSMPPHTRSGGGSESTSNNGNTQSGSSRSHGNGSGSGSGSGSSSGSSSGSGSSPNIAMIGGSEGESSREREFKEAPAPFALFGLPFWVFGRGLKAEADEAREESRIDPSEAQTPDRRVETAQDYERRRVERENREMLEQIEQRNARLERQPAPAPATGSARSADASISSELAALERSLARRSDAQPAPGPEAAAHTARAPLPPEPGLGTPHATDRNADGRPDLWSYHRDGRIAREVLDDDHDGRADRTLHYDATGRMTHSEEDLDGDGTLETVTLFRDGFVDRRRADTDGDGQADAWSFYERGDLVRNEVDRNGDGFRDLVTTYAGGQLASEREDRNGDGRADRVTLYEAGERREVREDVDFDGKPDIQSFYENGKLVRRTLSDLDKFEELLEPETR